MYCTTSQMDFSALSTFAVLLCQLWSLTLAYLVFTVEFYSCIRLRQNYFFSQILTRVWTCTLYYCFLLITTKKTKKIFIVGYCLSCDVTYLLWPVHYYDILWLNSKQIYCSQTIGSLGRPLKPFTLFVLFSLSQTRAVLLSKHQHLAGLFDKLKAWYCLLKTHSPGTLKEKQESLKDEGRPAKQN